MTRQIALAYAIAGLSTAIALVAVTSSTKGLLSTPDSAGFESRTDEPVVLASAGVSNFGAPTQATEPESIPAPVEYVYVDEPATRREHHEEREEREDDDDRGEHEGRERHEGRSYGGHEAREGHYATERDDD